MKMDQLLTNSKSLLPGFRFHPTDEELVVYFLKRKCLGKSLSPQMMSEVDVYQFPPWDLPEKSWMKTPDLSWYFFCPRSKKYACGARSNRTTEHGYWKSTGNDRTVTYNNRQVGKIKTLIFHLGKAPKGDRTDWVMHEYRLEDKALADKGVFQDLYATCKVYKKSGQGQKNGENYGAPFVEEDWETDDDDDKSLHTGVSIPLANEGKFQSVSAVTNTLPNHDCAPAPITPMMNDASFLLDTSPITPTNYGSCTFLQDIDPMHITEGDELEKLLAMCTEDDDDESLQTGIGIPLANGKIQSVSAVTNILPNHDCAPAPIYLMMNNVSFLLDTTPIIPMINDGSFLLDTNSITPMINNDTFILDTTPITPMNYDSCFFLQDIDPMQMIIDGDELEKLLAMCTEEDIDTPTVGNEKIAQEHNDTPPIGGTKNIMVDNDVYHGLGDLPQTSQTCFSWSQLAGEIGKDYYMDIDDLDEILNR